MKPLSPFREEGTPDRHPTPGPGPSAGGMALGAYMRFALGVTRVLAPLGPLGYVAAALVSLLVVCLAMALALGVNLLAAGLQAGPWAPFWTLAGMLVTAGVALHTWICREMDTGFRTLRLTLLIAGPALLLSAVLTWWMAPWLVAAAWDSTIAEVGTSGSALRRFIAGMGAWETETWLALATLIAISAGMVAGFFRWAAAFIDRALATPLGFAIQFAKVLFFCGTVGGVAWFLTTSGLLEPGGVEAFLRGGSG